jgi:hypothetical protein
VNDRLLRAKLRVLRDLHGTARHFAVTELHVYPSARPDERRIVDAVDDEPEPPEMIRLARAFWSAWRKLWNLPASDLVGHGEVRE